ncbi:MAG: tetratricopeptide repeat protein, partial [Gemmatimonadetes bacterium]|nr:tetratricopeptide repeat protein [Gemmatimonadota bacterium]
REYGAEPSAETRALIEAIRADRGVAAAAEDSGVPQPAAPRAAVTPVAAPDHAALPLRPPRRLHWSRLARSLAWTGRARTLAGAALALLLLASVAVWRYGSLGPRAGAPVTRVAVFPFSLRGSPELDYLREGVAELLSTSLDGAGQMVTVDARALLSLLSREKGVPGPDRARELAARLGAGSLVLGSIIEAGGRLELTASLYGRDGTVETVARAGTSREEGIFDVVDQLARGLVAGEYAGPRGRLTRLATLTTPSLPALKAYLAGESALRPGRFAQAAEAFQRAVAADTLFALGYYRLAVAAGWAADFALAQQAAERATRLAHRLSPRDRQLLTAYLAVRRGRSDEAENLYRDILRVYPDDVEAWYLLGETLFHYGRFRGRPAAQARPVFERALALDPEHGGSLAHLMDLAAMQGRFASYDSLLARSFSEGTPPVWRRAVRGFGLGDAQAREKLLAELRRTADQHVALSSRLVATQAHDLEGARQIARLLIEPTRAPQTRARGHFFLAQIELALGRWHAAWKQLDGAEELDHASALELRALYAALPFLPIPRREIERARDRLLHWNAAAVPPQPGSFYATHDGLHPVFRLYLLALLSLRLDDPTAAADFAAEIPRAAARGDSLHSSMLARSVQAQLAWRRGRPLQALAELSSSRPETWEENLGRSPFFSQAHERYLQAEILAELGRDQEALGGFESLAEHAVHELVYLPVAHLRRAEIHERNRQQQAAAQHYAHFLKLWEHCDPELLPLVTAARRRLAARGE